MIFKCFNHNLISFSHTGFIASHTIQQLLRKVALSFCNFNRLIFGGSGVPSARYFEKSHERPCDCGGGLLISKSTIHLILQKLTFILFLLVLSCENSLRMRKPLSLQRPTSLLQKGGMKQLVRVVDLFRK